MSDHDGMPISGVHTCRHCGRRILSSQDGWYAREVDLRPTTLGGTGDPWEMYACTKNPAGNHPHEPQLDVSAVSGEFTHEEAPLVAQLAGEVERLATLAGQASARADERAREVERLRAVISLVASQLHDEGYTGWAQTVAEAILGEDPHTGEPG